MNFFRNRRPYREVTTASLVKWRDELFTDIAWNAEHGFEPLNKSRRRELARITRELDYRSEGK